MILESDIDTVDNELSVVVTENDFDISFIKIEKRVSCIAHTIELIVGSIFDEKVKGNALIKKAFAIVESCRRKKKIAQYLRQHCKVSMSHLTCYKLDIRENRCCIYRRLDGDLHPLSSIASYWCTKNCFR